nr:putative oxidoreductase yohf [Quercus suber]
MALEEWGKLEGKVVMVTGASSGLGLDFCLDLAKAGCKIIAAARRVDRLQSLCHQINHLSSSTSSSSLRAVAVELDLCADGPTIDKSIQQAWDVFGHINALVNNAGFRGTVKSPLELSEEEWNHVIKTNLTGTWLVSKYIGIRMRDAERGGSIINISSIAGLDRGQLPGGAAYAASKTGLNTLTKVPGCLTLMLCTLGTVKSPLELSEEEWNHVIKTNLTGTWLVSKYIGIRMRDAERGGSIINISSIAGLDRGQLPGGAAYAASKTGLNTLTKVMALELGVHKIRVNSISPGLFKSEITQGLMEKEWLHKVAKKTVPLREYGITDPALTSLVRYLVHESSEYVSGNIFIVDGGESLSGVPIYSSL